MRLLLLLMAFAGAGCVDENADQLCIRHSNCPMGWYCSQGVCRGKTPAAVVVVDTGSSTDSGPTDTSTGDASDASSRSDAASVGDVSDGDVSDVLTDAALGDGANVTDVAAADSALGDALLGDVASSTDAASSDVDQVGDASAQDAFSDGGSVDPSSDTAVVLDGGPDPGPLDVPIPDLAPDAGIADRGFTSFPLPSFDTGFGKPR